MHVIKPRKLEIRPWIGVIFLFAVAAFGDAAPATADDARWAAVVEALASKNQPPVVANQAVPPAEPVVPAGFDRSEQDRVWKIAHELAGNAEDAWPSLVARLDDGRYALTVEHSVSGVVYENWTIGDICREIVLGNITAAYCKDVEWGTKEFYHRMTGERFTGGVKLKSWCEDRRGKPLFELQAEACRWAAGELAGRKPRQPDKAQSRSAAKIAAREKKLLDTKTAVRFHPFRGEFLRPYR